MYYYGNASTSCSGQSYNQMPYYPYYYGNNNSNYAIVLVLFILLVIVIGCRFAV